MSLNSMRVAFKHSAVWIMGFVTVAMVVTTFAWNSNGNFRNGSQAGASNGNDVIASINGQNITRREFDQTIDRMRQQMQQYQQPTGIAQMAYMYNYVLDSLIQNKLREDDAKKMGLQVTSKDTDAEREKLVTQGNFREALSLKPNASIADVDAALTHNGQQTLEDRWPDEMLTEQILLDKHKAKLDSSIKVTEQQIRDKDRKYHVQHILIKDSARSDEQAKKQAQDIIAKLQAGADFVTLGKQVSEDRDAKKNGGDDGWVDDTTATIQPFKTAAFHLKPGQIDPDPVKIQELGYYIVKLVAVKDTPEKDFQKNKTQEISDMERDQQQRLESTNDEILRNNPNNKIVINDPEIRAIRAVSEANRGLAPDAKKAKYTAAIADYQKALGKASSDYDKALINVMIAQAYAGLSQPNDEIKAYEAAVAFKGEDDASMELTLGNLYKDQKNNAKAIEHFQTAASLAGFDDISTHNQLQSLYTQLNQPKLAAAEGVWIKNYNDSHKQAAGAPGGITMAPTPAAAHTQVINKVINNGATTIKPTVIAAPGASPHQPRVVVTDDRPRPLKSTAVTTPTPTPAANATPAPAAGKPTQ